MSLLFFLLLFLAFCYGEVRHGIASSSDGFFFLGKFCFDWNPQSLNRGIKIGSVRIALKKKDAKEKIRDLDILQYDDQPSSWPMIYDRGYKVSTCEGKRSYAMDWNNASMDVQSSFQVKWDLNNAYASNQFSIYEHLRPRFWYYAIANCEPFKDIEYTIEFKNVIYSPFNQQFGRDIKGLNIAYLFFASAYVIIAVIQCVATFKHWNTSGYLHPILKLYNISLLFQFIAVTIYTIHYIKFSFDGEISAMNVVAKIFDILARVVLILLLLLLSRGWTISSEALSGKKELFSVCGIFLLLQIIILIWQTTIEDPAATKIPIFYQVCLSLLDVVWISFGIFFLLSTYQTYKAEENSRKKALYIKMAAFYGPWIITLPVFVFLMLAVEPWDRELTVRCFHQTFTFLANAVMVYLTWPSRALEYFSIALPKIHYGPAMTGFNSDYM